MGNIIGESFNNYVADQINVRQQKLGSVRKTNDTLSFLSGKAPYLKLTSGVNISTEKCREIGIPTEYADSNLAKNFILFGGTAFKDQNDRTRLRLGLSTNYSDQFANVSYGLVSNADYGLSPMPGLMGATVKSLNRGSLRESELTIKCYNKLQFQIIETLFLRLKYSFLLEFGHSIYFDNQSEIVTNALSNSDYFLAGGKTQTEILSQLETTREASGGNYDAFLGYVKNFTWDLNADGTYDITVKGITPGDVIESLKINVLKHDPTEEADDEDDEKPSIEKNKDKSTLNLIFNALKEKAEEGDSWITGELAIVTLDTVYSSFLKQKIPSLPNIKGNLQEKYRSYLAPGNNDFSALGDNADIFASVLDQTAINTREVIRLEFGFDDDTTGEEQLYIKFGCLCRLIELYCLVYDTSNSKQPPVVSIDTDYNSNYCFTVPEQFSTDPRICMIPLQPTENLEEGLKEEDNGWNRFWSWVGVIDDGAEKLSTLNEALSSEFRTSEPYVGRLMHVHVNANYISNILSENIDENGDLSIYDFFTNILQGVQRSLGGINKFEVIYNEDTNSIRFMDNTYIPGAWKLQGEEDPIPTRINVNTFKVNEGSFVKDVSIRSELTKEIAAMMTIGAQANGNVVGENATAFSNWNKGCTDRVMKEKQNATEPPPPSNNASPAKKSPEEQFAEYRKKVLKYLLRVVRLKLDEDDIDTYSSSFRPYLNYIVGTLSQESTNPDTGETVPPKIPPIGFIPLSLDITMLGMSGMKIYQKYTINEDLLPPNYRNKIEFLTKGISHNIGSDGWYTTIDGQTIPKNSTSSQTSDNSSPSSSTGSYPTPSQGAQTSPNTEASSPDFDVDENADEICDEIIATAPARGGEPTGTYRKNGGYSKFFSPIGDQRGAITSPYSGNKLRDLSTKKDSPYKKAKKHRGIDIDIFAPPNKFPLYALWDGEIIQTTSGGGGFRTVYKIDTDSLRRDAPYIYNNLVSDYGLANNDSKFKVSEGGQIIVTYYHEEPKNPDQFFGRDAQGNTVPTIKGAKPCVPPGISSGAKIIRGQFMGVANNTGGSTGAHLHVNINIAPRGEYWANWIFSGGKSGNQDPRNKSQLNPAQWVYINGTS